MHKPLCYFVFGLLTFCVQAAPAEEPAQLHFSHGSGLYSESFNLTLSPSNPDLEIYYTLDGSIPNQQSLTTAQYQAPLQITDNSREHALGTHLVRAALLDKEPSVLKKLTNKAVQLLNRLIQKINSTLSLSENAIDELKYLNYLSSHIAHSYVFHPDKETNATDLPVLIINTTYSPGVESRSEWVEGSYLLGESAAKLEIKGRGNTTWGMPKKPYSIKLDRKDALAGMQPHRRWVLLQNHLDRTLLRNKTAFEIGKRLDNLQWTPDSRHVELVLNGSHLGNYLLTEQIRIGKSRLDISESSEYPLRGGHLLLLDKYNEKKRPAKLSWESTIISDASGDQKKEELPYTVRRTEAKDPVKAKRYLRKHISEIERALISPDQDRNLLYKEHIDIGSFIDYYIALELTGNQEPNHPKSVFMFQSEDGKINAGPLWDFDWGTFRDIEGFNLRNSVWYGSLFQDPYFIQIFQLRWLEVLPRLETLPEFIDHELTAIERSFVLNEQLWDISSYTINNDESMSAKEAVEKMKAVYTARLKWMDNEIMSWSEDPVSK